MLTRKINKFINKHTNKELSEYIKKDPQFILKFINKLKWTEKVEFLKNYTEVTENGAYN
jgi:hypothetical protein